MTVFATEFPVRSNVNRAAFVAEVIAWPRSMRVSGVLSSGCESNLDVPSRMIKYFLAGLAFSWQDRFCGSAAEQKTVRGTVFPPHGTGGFHADLASRLSGQRHRFALTAERHDDAEGAGVDPGEHGTGLGSGGTPWHHGADGLQVATS